MPTPRSGSLTIAGQTFSVTQSASGVHLFDQSPTSQSVAAGGGTGSTTVTAPTGCAWTGVSNTPLADGDERGQRQRPGNGRIQRGSESEYDAAQRLTHDWRTELHRQPGRRGLRGFDLADEHDGRLRPGIRVDQRHGGRRVRLDGRQ